MKITLTRCKTRLEIAFLRIICTYQRSLSPGIKSPATCVRRMKKLRENSGGDRVAESIPRLHLSQSAGTDFRQIVRAEDQTRVWEHDGRHDDNRGSIPPSPIYSVRSSIKPTV